MSSAIAAYGIGLTAAFAYLVVVWALLAAAGRRDQAHTRGTRLGGNDGA